MKALNAGGVYKESGCGSAGAQGCGVAGLGAAVAPVTERSAGRLQGSFRPSDEKVACALTHGCSRWYACWKLLSQNEIHNKILLQIIVQLGIFREWCPPYRLACEQSGACWDLVTLVTCVHVLPSSGNRISRCCAVCLGNTALYLTFNFAN